MRIGDKSGGYVLSAEQVVESVVKDVEELEERSRSRCGLNLPKR